MGMGGAFVALADDASAIFFNPAGLGQLEKSELAAAYDRLYAGLGDDSLGRGLISYVYPSQSHGAFAMNTSLLHTPFYKETTITFGYGRSFGQAYLGANAKGLFVSFDDNEYTKLDPLFSNSSSVNGVAIDLGLMYKLTNSFTFGLAALNVNQPNMALGEGAESEVPLILQTGLALKSGDTVATIDFAYRNKDLRDDPDINVHFGIESWLADGNMALRGGVNFHDMAVGASYIFNRGKDIDAQFDYAFRYPLSFKEDSISDIYGTHQVSLNVRFSGIATAQPEEDAQKVDMYGTRTEAASLMSKVKNYRKEGKYEEVINLCDEVLAKEFDGAETYHLEAGLQKGGTLAQLERYDEAIEALELAVRTAPQNPRTHYELGMAYKKYGDSTENRSWYNKARIELEKTRIIDHRFRDVSAQLNELSKKR